MYIYIYIYTHTCINNKNNNNNNNDNNNNNRERCIYIYIYIMTGGGWRRVDDARAVAEPVYHQHYVFYLFFQTQDKQQIRIHIETRPSLIVSIISSISFSSCSNSKNMF